MVTRLRLGDLEVYAFVENRMRLDGGAMFGVIPKKVWTKQMSCDEDNRIELDLNLLLIKSAGKTFLVDTGCGDVGTDREQGFHGLDTPTQIENHLRLCGVEPDELDYVLFSHLHFDHSSGGLKRNAKGFAITRFPKATYVVNKIEWEDALWPNERTRATYVPEYMETYEKSGQMQVVDGPTEIAPGISLVPTGGHTAGHQAIEIRGGGHALGYYGDIFPTQVHLKTAWVPAVDTFPLESLKVKKEILKACVDEPIWLAFDHDTDLKLARVHLNQSEYTAVSLETELQESVS